MKPVGIIIAVILGIVFLTLIVAKELELDLFRNEPMEYSINTLEELCVREKEIFITSNLAQQLERDEIRIALNPTRDIGIFVDLHADYGNRFLEEFDINPNLISHIYHRLAGSEIPECKS